MPQRRLERRPDLKGLPTRIRCVRASRGACSRSPSRRARRPSLRCLPGDGRRREIRRRTCLRSRATALATRVIASGALATALTAGLLGAGCGGARSGTPAASVGGSAVTALAVYGLAGPPPRLYAVDPRTLRPRRDRSAPTNGHAFGWSFSPDRSRLAAGSDGTAELRLYDLKRLRVLGDVDLVEPSVHGLVYATTWAGRSRVLAAVVSPGCCGLGDTFVSAVDASSRRVLWRRDLQGSLQAGARYRGGFVLVLGPKYAIGPPRVVVVARSGRLWTAPLAQISSGWQRSGGGARFVSHQWNPGLALDAASGRAFVVQGGAPVAEVDLRRLSVRYHELSEPIS